MKTAAITGAKGFVGRIPTRWRPKRGFVVRMLVREINSVARLRRGANPAGKYGI